jgi:hypothetical protein
VNLLQVSSLMYITSHHFPRLAKWCWKCHEASLLIVRYSADLEVLNMLRHVCGRREVVGEVEL